MFAPGYVKVSARVKRGEFSKFLILRRSDKAFQELSFRKIPQKIFQLSSDWAENVTESNKGLLLRPRSMELNGQPSAECDPLSASTWTFSAGRSKIMVKEPLEDLESGSTETWQKLHGQTAGEDERIGDLSLLLRERWPCGKSWIWFHLDVPVAEWKLSVALN